MAQARSESTPDFRTFAEFWPFYLSEHSHPLNRRLHFIGTTGFLGSLLTFIITQNPWWIPLMPLLGYGFAWVGHFKVEKNKPASFKHPLWSFIGDHKMYLLMLTGRL